MCGIAGFWNRGSDADLASKLPAVSKNLKHRGPDAEGVWLSDDKRVGLLHRRLAIIDLNERARQPMISRSGRSIVSFNGEIYNFRELRKELNDIAGPFPWRTTSDTEILLEGIEGQGPVFLKRLDGMFAFAQFDHEKQQLHLAVDPFGKKPLYTYWDGKIFAFASEISAFHAMGLSLEIDQEGLSEYLLFGSPFGEATVYKNVRRMLGGHTQTITRTSIGRQEPYWDLPLGQFDRVSTYKSAVEQTKALVHRAVEKRLIADVPIACFLSGGLDSSVVAFEAQKILGAGEPLHTYSVGFEGDALHDETGYALTTAKRIGSRHEVLRGGQQTTAEAEQILKCFGEPFSDSSSLPTFELCRTVSAKAKVALSGDGGDEIFGGYRRMQAALFTERWSPLLRLLLDPLAATGISAKSPRSKLGFALRLQSALQLPTAERLLRWNQYFAVDDLKRTLGLTTERISQTLSDWNSRLDGHDVGQKILYFNAKTYLFSDLLPKVDRMSMANSLEVRSPLLDRDLAEFAFRLPTEFKFSARQTKKILKDAYRKDLGRDITDRSKKGFAVPLKRLLNDWQQSSSASNRLKLSTDIDLTTLVETKRGHAGFEACAFAAWSAAVNLNSSRSTDQ